MKYRLASRMSELTASEIREILKVTARPEVISFAGGLPAPELFPGDDLAEEAERLLKEEGAMALQYSTTEGYAPLRKWISERMNGTWGTNLVPDEILITSGSQQGLDLTAKLFLDEGDLVFTESPTYLAALGSFKVFLPRFVEIPTDDEGMVLEALEARLREEKPKLIYVVPNGQNPSGRTWSVERRQKFMEIVTRHEVPVIEDNAYFEVLFDCPKVPSMKAFDPKDLVVCLGSFSKVLCPGLRVGWVAAHPEILAGYVILKQSTDLHTASFSQMLIHRYLQTCDFEARLTRIRETYRFRRDAMLAALEEEMPEGVTWTRPAGGMFLWLTLPEGIDGHALLARCLEHNVAFVPGAAFFAHPGHGNTARLNYSNMPPERIREGIRRFAQVLREMMASMKPTNGNGKARASTMASV